MVQACLPAVPRIKTVTDGLGSVKTEMLSIMEEQDDLLVIDFKLSVLGTWRVIQSLLVH